MTIVVDLSRNLGTKAMRGAIINSTNEPVEIQASMLLCAVMNFSYFQEIKGIVLGLRHIFCSLLYNYI